MTRISFIALLTLSLSFLAGTAVRGQGVGPDATPTPATQSSSAADQKPKSLESQFFKNIVKDQAAIWTSPFKLHAHDARWLVPFGAVTAGLIATDRHTSAWVSSSGSLPAASRGVSFEGSVYVTAGTAAAFYLAGRATGNRRARETGLLSAEALIDSTIVTQVLKAVMRRPRPDEDDGHGRFFTGGRSFPSGHAASVWSVATVVAHEYHDRAVIKYGAYAIAAAVSMSRYTGRDHFLSDILVGSAIGFGVGRFVYHKHHVPQTSLPSDDQALPGTTTKWMPLITPIFDRRTATFGGQLVWNL